MTNIPTQPGRVQCGGPSVQCASTGGGPPVISTLVVYLDPTQFLVLPWPPPSS